MTDKPANKDTDAASTDLPPAARRALAEAQARREAADEAQRAAEINGRKGPEPTRFGDWEKDGMAIDF